MEAHKPHLDVLYQELRSNKDNEDLQANLSRSMFDLIEDNETLTEDWQYELFLEHLFKNGETIFNHVAIIANSLSLIMTGKSHVSESYNRIGQLWHELNKME